jgi:uncharacterized membrane protein YfcA
VIAGVAIPIGAWSLALRFRRAGGVERQQLRWLAVGAVAVAVAALAAQALTGNRVDLDWLPGVCLAILPLAIGAAILRYRLYDLDRIISRTVTYGLLTMLLGLGYAGAVLGLGRLLPQAPASWWLERHWRWRRCSSRPAAASRRWWIVGSTAAAMTPP